MNRSSGVLKRDQQYAIAVLNLLSQREDNHQGILAAQTASVRISVDEEHSDDYRVVWRLTTTDGVPRFSFQFGRPAMGVAIDADDGTLIVQLLVVDGLISEMEWFKAEDTKILMLPSLDSIRVYDVLAGETQTLVPP